MLDDLSRIEGRVHQIRSLLGEPDPSNKDFGKELQQASGATQTESTGGAPGRRAAAPPESLAPYIQEAASRTGLPRELIEGVISAESAYRSNAVSPVGAQGLMQLMPGTAKSLGVSDPFDPRQNILGGSEYLRRQLTHFGSVEKALAAYNAGPGAVERYGGVPPYRETQNYVRRIMGRLHGSDPTE